MSTWISIVVDMSPNKLGDWCGQDWFSKLQSHSLSHQFMKDPNPYQITSDQRFLFAHGLFGVEIARRVFVQKDQSFSAINLEL